MEYNDQNGGGELSPRGTQGEQNDGNAPFGGGGSGVPSMNLLNHP